MEAQEILEVVKVNHIEDQIEIEKENLKVEDLDTVKEITLIKKDQTIIKKDKGIVKEVIQIANQVKVLQK